MFIRKAALSDLDAIAAVEAACFPKAEAADKMHLCIMSMGTGR